jgi:NAD(P)-dependent dehydrogenase (short-subunit alcohol dehydrogenase family)
MNKTVMITGANAGIGKETARQLALLPNTEKIYLACRNKLKAESAVKELVSATGKQIFEIIIMDLSDIESVRASLKMLKEPIDALIMNAGGNAGRTPNKITPDGVTQIFAANALGHIVLLDELLKTNKLRNVALFAGSEAARGIPLMGIKGANLQTSSVDEFVSICDGTYFKKSTPLTEIYALVKYTATMSLMATARQYPHIRIITMSPGGTIGTEIATESPTALKIIWNMAVPIMHLLGLMHKVDVAAKRYVDGITKEKYKSGVFYASKSKMPVGEVVDQTVFMKDLQNKLYQDNAYKAVHQFMK